MTKPVWNYRVWEDSHGKWCWEVRYREVGLGWSAAWTTYPMQPSHDWPQYSEEAATREAKFFIARRQAETEAAARHNNAEWMYAE